MSTANKNTAVVPQATAILRYKYDLEFKVACGCLSVTGGDSVAASVATSSLVTLAVPVFVRFSVMDLLLSAIPVTPPLVLSLLSAVAVGTLDGISIISFPVALAM